MAPVDDGGRPRPARLDIERATRALGQAVRERRLALGLSQAELARRAGHSRPWVSDVERGRTNPNLDMLLDLAEDGLDMRLSELLRRAVEIERGR